MTILITGATGKLGKALAKEFQQEKINYSTYSHVQELKDVNWCNFDTIINCSGVLPSKNVKPSDFYAGNVLFLQKLISFSARKTFVHFSTFSELYRNDFYQKSKMIANSLLLANNHIFTKLYILPLPTLEDETLINSIVKSALVGNNPIVDDLDYNFMSIDAVAKHVVNGIKSGYIKPISDLYIKKNLYTNVCKIVPAELITKGLKIDRQLISNNIYTICPQLISNLQNN